ncbi:hypothetical protein SNOG_06932 [Parastagonospora nodorum SN15]|uniref:Uncharacterized protein n=1 Tax=Phaeosphaeria nodorum (strain SN15 / ATCC MYA-4574 / FGSC 10173) TaxID=321614 RepID=Q0UMT2_PHANO|nr:hypothetical protein SNOG_06932 [Parastagonospora nodorum SN15]EAT85583.1 hypothetical protein SNOG_06932 [Parastagonospora nodorum SN15]
MYVMKDEQSSGSVPIERNREGEAIAIIIKPLKLRLDDESRIM